jgi:hypothetical protein
MRTAKVIRLGAGALEVFAWAQQFRAVQEPRAGTPAGPGPAAAAPGALPGPV